MRLIRWYFGPQGQMLMWVLLFVAAVVQWALAILHLDDQRYLIRLVTHASMEALLFAAYGGITTVLGYKATEEVKEIVARDVDVEHADQVFERELPGQRGPVGGRDPEG